MEEMRNDNLIVLTDEDGNDVEFEVIDLVEYEGESYVVLIPTAEGEDDQAVILKVEGAADDDEDEIYSSVEDEDTLNAVFEIFKERFKDIITFED